MDGTTRPRLPRERDYPDSPTMTTIPLTVAGTLQAAGRNPVLPFRVALADGRQFVVHRLLRVLPGKRLVGEAELEGCRVLAKLFVGRRCKKHWQQEQAGLEALALAGVPTPRLIAATPMAAGGYALFTAFLDPAESLSESWARVADRSPGDGEALATLAPVLSMLGRLHAAGLVQDDLHLGNFLRHEGRLFVIDGDSVRIISRGQPLPLTTACANLAVLLAQLSPEWDGHEGPLLHAYRVGAANSFPELPSLTDQVARVRAWRLRDFLAKTVRDCTLFAVERTVARFSAVVRREAEALRRVLATPDSAISAGLLLKESLSCTVAKVVVNGRLLVVKRYSLRDLTHALSRLCRPSRAWNCWREGHRFLFLGIPTPTPLAIIEERVGPLRRRAFLITDFCSGPNLLSHLSADCEPAEVEARAILGLFASMHRHRISHGDLKATNLLWDGGRVVVIDLDAAVQHRSCAAYARAWRRDRARLLRNWPPGSVLHRWLDERLPAA
jgi:tRNA A-37 threonylcarbamoyl transferase component Bud32